MALWTTIFNTQTLGFGVFHNERYLLWKIPTEDYATGQIELI